MFRNSSKVSRINRKRMIKKILKKRRKHTKEENAYKSHLLFIVSYGRLSVLYALKLNIYLKIYTVIFTMPSNHKGRRSLLHVGFDFMRDGCQSNDLQSSLTSHHG